MAKSAGRRERWLSRCGAIDACFCFTSGPCALWWETSCPSRRAQFLAVVGEELRIVSPARDGDIGHAVVKQVFRAQFGIDVDQHAVRRLPLAGMTRHRIPMIEMRMQTRIELQLVASVHLQTQPSVLADTLHRSQLTVRRLQLARGRGELRPVSGGERPLLLTISNNLNR